MALIAEYDFRRGSEGFTFNGTAATYDPARGFHGGTDGSLQLLGFDDSQLVNQGTIIMYVERSQISYDYATYTPSGYEGLSGRTDERASAIPFAFRENGGFTRETYFSFNGGVGSITFHCDAATTTARTYTRKANYYTKYFDDTFAEILITWDGTNTYYYIDGALRWINDRTYNAGDFYTVDICNRGTNAATAFDGWFRNIQFYNDFQKPRLSPIRVSINGDSFVQGGFLTATPANETEAGIDATANASAINDTYAQIAPSSRGDANFGHQVIAAIGKVLNVEQPIYVAAYPGRGWNSDLNEFSDGMMDAVASYGASVHIAAGSVNSSDTNLSDVSNDAIYSTITTKLDRIIDNNPALEKIFYISTPWTTGTFSETDEASHRASHKQIREIEKRVHGYRGKVFYVDLYTAWSGDDGEPDLANAYGSDPSNTVDATSDGTPTQSKRTSSFNGDVHANARGNTIIAEAISDILIQEIAENYARRAKDALALIQ